MDKTNYKLIIEKYKYPILVLCLGLALLLLPGSSSGKVAMAEKDELLSTVLSCTEGVGSAKVIVSEKGVVVVCSGAGDAMVRLEIIRAVGSYTGFSSDRITVLKMAQGK